jgi:hypothetical protein
LTRRSFGSLAPASAALALLFLLTEGFFFLASLARPALVFDVGPSTGAYLEGFTESEERLPVTFRWTRGRARISLPVVARAGTAGLEIRYARFVDTEAEARVFVNGRAAGTFTARPGRFRTQRLAIELPEGPLQLELLTLSSGAGELGLAVDWVRVPNGGFQVPIGLWRTRLLVGGAFLVCLLSGMSASAALGGGLAVAALESTWAAIDPFGLAHASTQLAIPAIVAACICAFFLKRYPRGRWVTIAFFAGYLLKGAGVFYPSYFYPDVRNHRRYIWALAEARGSLPERGLEAQRTVRTAYPRTIGGRVYAMPYSPLYFVPFTWLPKDPHIVEHALKHVSLACAAIEMVAVFFLARALWGEGVAWIASLLSAFLPPLESRLLLAMYPTIAGHLLDLVSILMAARLAQAPDSRPRLAAFFTGLSASFLTYIASLFNLSGFALSWALFEARVRSRVLAAWAVAAVGVVALLYADFSRTFLVEIVPALWTGSPAPVEGLRSSGGLLEALGRIPLFFGWGYPPLVAAGFLLARRNLKAASFHVVAAYASSFLLLVLLRALPGGMFRDLKEVTYAAPLFAICAGASVDAIAARSRLAAWLVAVTLIAFGVTRYWGYLTPVTRLAGLD